MIFIRKNTKALRDKIKSLGVDICCCAEFDGWDWLHYGSSTELVHGVPPFNSDPVKRLEEGDRGLFLAELNAEDVDCGENEELFIELLKEMRYAR